MRPDVTHGSVTERQPGGSALCLACGLCCNGALHTSVTVRPEHVRLVRTLGLTVEKAGDHEFEFRQPCPLYQQDRCSAYPYHPPSCQEYRCALLQKYENGEVTLSDGQTIARTAKALLAGGVEPLAAGAAVSSESLRVELAQSWDGAHGLRGSGARRRANADVVFRAVTLDVYLEKHFRLPRNESDGSGAQTCA